MMALLSSIPLLFPSIAPITSVSNFPNPNPNPNPRYLKSRRGLQFRCSASPLCEKEEASALTLDKRLLAVKEYFTEEELLAAVRLRVRTFYDFSDSSLIGVQDHKRYLTEREYEGLKERVAGMRIGFKRVSCINVTLPSSPWLIRADELHSMCKGIEADLTRAYLSNVCVAKELQRNGLGYALVAKSKEVAYEWGITDLYVHVAVDNKSAQKLYEKCGFVYENEEPSWQARFLVNQEAVDYSLQHCVWEPGKET